MIATPVFGYKSHISIDRRFGFIREAAVTSASAADGRQLKRLVSRDNTGSEVWADSLSQPEEREVADGPDADEPHPPAQARGQADA